MSNHWPVLIAILFVGAATTYGIYMQNEAEEKGRVEMPVKSISTKYVANATVKPVNFPSQVPVVAPAPFPTAQAAPAPVQHAAPILGGTDRDTVFNNLKTSLKQKFGAAPQPTANGFALVVDGARIDADTTQNWQVSIYNLNQTQPMVQTENYLAIMNLVAASFEFDLNMQSQTTADGKISRRPQTAKMGRMSLVTDPAMHNSSILKPIIKKVQQPIVAGVNPGQGQIIQNVQPRDPNARVKPKLPAAPVAPVAPPKPPTADQF